MSHISTAKVGIRIQPSTFDILKECAEEMGGQVLSTMTVNSPYTSERIQSGFVVKYQGMSIGVTEKNGDLSLVGDHYHHDQAWTSFQQKLPMRFKAKATVLALKKLGFKTTVKEKDKVLVVEGC